MRGLFRRGTKSTHDVYSSAPPFGCQERFSFFSRVLGITQIDTTGSVTGSHPGSAAYCAGGEGRVPEDIPRKG